MKGIYQRTCFCARDPNIFVNQHGVSAVVYARNHTASRICSSRPDKNTCYIWKLFLADSARRTASPSLVLPIESAFSVRSSTCSVAFFIDSVRTLPDALKMATM